MIESRAPGRVNLIGEHTDYSGGFVLPCAIGYYTHVRGTPRTDRLCCVRSAFGTASFELDRLAPQRNGDWSDYIRGVLLELRENGVMLSGADFAIEGNVPIGAGLSSSASLEIAVALAVLQMTRTRMDPMALAKLAQQAENAHAGTHCGIMDQAAVLQGRENCAMLLDTRSLEAEHIAVPPGAAIVICNTMVSHELASGAYNERRRECEEGAALLARAMPGVRTLRDVSRRELDDGRSVLPETLYRRARHVVSENARVLQAAQALRERNASRFGELMNASHESLRTDYEVSCEELDVMARLSREYPGAYGARMTGGGFGGCVVALVDARRAAGFRTYISGAYRSAMGIAPEIYDGSPVAGAEIVRE